MLTLSPLARGLFKRTIAESGVPGPPRSAGENEAVGTQLPKLLHLPAGDLKALRGAAAEAVLAAAQSLKQPPGIDPGLLWGQQIVDGWVEPAPIADVYARHLEAPVPMIIGNNTREFALDFPPDTLRALVREHYGARATDVLKIYGLTDAGPTTDDPVLGNAGTQFVTDVGFRCPANWVARHLLAAGLKVWRYEFGLPLPGTNGPVAHNAELKYVFDAAPPGATFAAWPPVQQYWVNFAKSGDPGGPGLPVWPDMGKDLTYMAFSPSGPATGTKLRGGVCGDEAGK
jgi:para-nitrobenzyl esterase